MKQPSPELLLAAYAQGIFPMAHEELDGEIYWYAPDPRAIIPLDAFHASRRLRQRVRSGEYEVRVNTCFERVMQECAAPRGVDGQTWISAGLIEVYTHLHHMGVAHSVETWSAEDGELVGGLYGVALGGLFAGESMFHRRTDASKVALVALVERMKAQGMTLLDIQFMTPHLATFGATEIPRAEYEARLAEALRLPVNFVTRGKLPF